MRQIKMSEFYGFAQETVDSQEHSILYETKHGTEACKAVENVDDLFWELIKEKLF